MEKFIRTYEHIGIEQWERDGLIIRFSDTELLGYWNGKENRIEALICYNGKMLFYGYIDLDFCPLLLTLFENINNEQGAALATGLQGIKDNSRLP